MTSELADVKIEVDNHPDTLLSNTPTTNSTTTPDPWDIDAELDDHCSGMSGDTLTCSSVMTPDPWDIIDAEAVNTLFHAVLSGDADEVRALSSDGVYISPLDSWIFFEACLQGPNMIHAFCNNPWVDLGQPLAGPTGGALINYLLKTAASRFPLGKRDTIIAVLQQAVNPIVYDHCGNHALHILAESAETDAAALMKLFLCGTDSGCDFTAAACVPHINSRNWPKLGSEFGNTPLTLAVLRNNIECVHILLQNGADPTSRGEFDQTAMQLAVSRRFYNSGH
ncbi:Ankyrin repeat-containing domain protein [Cordyceps fumosorosea ARSEF 2679]|uniref:Ankyrin repeat-containing domain protein n=1 Tax=Cordyceps fumosorosea (strain ARSEF 2679) TaxID=1081104 RepID=A0A162IEF9_CORFA|nr:Ankyrin repeat-containing domain protein [Cordyceps fumosorosea ARSEF 2679]OAA55985.1 Ankyrin repeat-containing domain protein [Cordyceps fumosorosea ARSEF 2679]